MLRIHGHSITCSVKLNGIDSSGATEEGRNSFPQINQQAGESLVIGSTIYSSILALILMPEATNIIILLGPACGLVQTEVSYQLTYPDIRIVLGDIFKIGYMELT